jgi:hypothetical protein
MVDEQQFAVLRHSVREWSDWRAGDETIIPRLGGADLPRANLSS